MIKSVRIWWSFNRAIRIIRNDAKTRKVLMDVEGNTCAVGGLLLAIGLVPLVERQNLTREEEYALFEAFPFLSQKRLSSIMTTNDTYLSRDTRIEKLTALINGWRHVPMQ